MPHFPLLAIETSQRDGGVALALSADDVRTQSFMTSSRHDDALMPAIDQLMQDAGCHPTDLGGVACSLGPGGFTGLRIAVSTVKMIAFAHSIPVFGIPSGNVVAAAARTAYPDELKDESILIALASKRGNAWFHRDGVSTSGNAPRATHASWESAADVELAPGGRLFRVLIGDSHMPDALAERARAADIPMIEPNHCPRALVNCVLARTDSDDPLTLRPIYPTEPEAVLIWNAREVARTQAQSENRP